MALVHDKQQAREVATRVRDVCHAALAATAPGMIAAHVFPVAPFGQAIVSGFYPTKSEISTLPLLRQLVQAGWRSCLPVVVGKDQPLLFRHWLPDTPLVAGKWGIEVPPLEADVLEPDALLVPLLAFDRRGYRLGYGGGFYDRTLATLMAQKPIVTIGVAYSGQEIHKVPHEAHDMALDWIVTEREVITCG